MQVRDDKTVVSMQHYKVVYKQTCLRRGLKRKMNIVTKKHQNKDIETTTLKRKAMV